MKRRTTELLIAAAALAAAACGSDNDNRQVCTDLFAYINATAVDSAGQPANGPFAVRDSVHRTGSVVTIRQVGLPAPGEVTIFSDSDLGEVRETGDAVTVTGTAEGNSFAAVFTIGSDGCHVRKLAGPDTVIVR